MTISLTYLQEQFPLWLERVETELPMDMAKKVCEGSYLHDEALKFSFSVHKNLAAFECHQPKSAQVLARSDFIILRAISSFVGSFPGDQGKTFYSVGHFAGTEATGFVEIINADELTRRSDGNLGYGFSLALPQELVETWLWDTKSWHLAQEPLAAVGTSDPRCFIRHWSTPWAGVSRTVGKKNAKAFVVPNGEFSQDRLEMSGGIILEDARVVMDSRAYGKGEAESFQVIADAEGRDGQLYIIRNLDLRTFEKFESAVSRIDRFCAGVLMGEDTVKLSEAI